MAHCKILFSLETAANHKSEAFAICCQVSDRIRRMKTVERKGERESGGQMDMTAKKDSVRQSDSAQISLGCAVLLRGESNREIITTTITTINNKSLSTSWVIDCAKRQGRKGKGTGQAGRYGQNFEHHLTGNQWAPFVLSRYSTDSREWSKKQSVQSGGGDCCKNNNSTSVDLCPLSLSLLLSFACRFKSEKTYTKGGNKHTHTHSPSIRKEKKYNSVSGA